MLFMHMTSFFQLCRYAETDSGILGGFVDSKGETDESIDLQKTVIHVFDLLLVNNSSLKDFVGALEKIPTFYQMNTLAFLTRSGSK